MATASSVSSEQVLTDINEHILLCAICMERFKSPKILPCLHTYCEPCLTEWVKTNNNQLICPTCKESFPLPSGGVPAIANNRFMNDLQQILGDVNSDSQKSVCEVCTKEAKFWCQDCGEFFCDDCVKTHKTMRLLKGHKLITVDEYGEKMSSEHFRLIQPRFCERHPNTQLEFYCDSCQVPTCLKCTVVEHKSPNHDIISVDTALEKYTPVMKQYSMRIAKRVSDLKMARDSACDIGKVLDKHKAEAESQIKELSSKIISEVKKQEMSLLNEVVDKYSPKSKQIASQVQLLEHKLVSAESMHSYLNHILSFGGAVDIISAKNEIGQRMHRDDALPSNDDIDGSLSFREDPKCRTMKLGYIDTKKVKSQETRPNQSEFAVRTEGNSYRASAVTSAVYGGDDDDDNRCPICLDQLKKPRRLPCKHAFCKKCKEEAERVMGPTCPVCKVAYGIITGNMPNGTMTDRVIHNCLPGYLQCGTIVISYDFKSGRQGKEHPNPGRPYTGTTRTAYLPYNIEGKEVLRLLRIAFDRRLTFTIGMSVTTGANDTLIWNDIHHKTSIHGGPRCYGYPDPDYLRRVKEELAAKGVK